jgi:hypothetical protein
LIASIYPTGRIQFLIFSAKEEGLGLPAVPFPVTPVLGASNGIPLDVSLCNVTASLELKIFSY